MSQNTAPDSSIRKNPIYINVILGHHTDSSSGFESVKHQEKQLKNDNRINRINTLMFILTSRLHKYVA